MEFITEPPTPQSPRISLDYSSFHNTNKAIVIDNGSWKCRAGWAGEREPRLNFENTVSKYRDRRLSQQVCIVGDNVNFDSTTRGSLRSAFENGVMVNSEITEYVLDYIFHKLGINTSSVDHPLVITEPLCNPPHCRKLLSELAFECYRVPSISYGIDSLFSFYRNGYLRSGIKDGIVVSAGNYNTTVIPVLNGVARIPLSKRISYGGNAATEYMLKQMQTKYPSFPSRMTRQQAEMLCQKYAYVAEDYPQELRAVAADAEKFKEIDKVVQFPYLQHVLQEKTEEEIAQAAAKKEEQRQRLIEQAAKQRAQKLREKEEKLAELRSILEMKEDSTAEEFAIHLREAGFSSEHELSGTVKSLEASVRRQLAKQAGLPLPEEPEVIPSFPLIDIPDEDLSSDQIKEKRKQRLLKAGYDARMRGKKEKEEERLRIEKEKRLEEERRENDFDGWLKDLKEKRLRLWNKVKERQKLKEALSDRRSHASQMRMRMMASLADDGAGNEINGKENRKRKRGKQEDTFGKDDEDWLVYREISKEEESDDETDDTEQLAIYEEQLLQYDPNFVPEEILELREARRKSILHRLANGVEEYEDDDIATQHQIHVNLERCRVAEVLWEPNIIGLDEAGLTEVLKEIIGQFGAQEQNRMCQNIFATGSFSSIPNFSTRLYRDIRMIRPVESPVAVKTAQDPVLDAWKGASLWGSNEDLRSVSVTRKMYEEFGGEYIAEHGLGNLWYGNWEKMRNRVMLV